jgi:FkbM family methyltransferase
MEHVTSELKFTNINVKPELYNLNYYKDEYTLLYEKGFTEHLDSVCTRYSPVFYFYRGDNIIGNSLKFYGEYTEGELQLLSNFLQPGYVVYDIGANIGVHTVAFAKQAKHVYAFEPNKHNFKLLDINTTHNRNVTIYDCAVGDTVGTTQIEHISLDVEGNYGECRITDNGQVCDVVTIDSLVHSKEILPPNLVKIDVEGYEWPVIQGMLQTIKDNLPVIFYEAMHCDLVSIYDTLVPLGYELFYYPCPNYNPNNFNKNKDNIFGQGGVLNILAAPFYFQIKTNLPKVISRDDTWADCYKRLTENVTKD